MNKESSKTKSKDNNIKEEQRESDDELSFSDSSNFSGDLPPVDAPKLLKSVSHVPNPVKRSSSSDLSPKKSKFARSLTSQIRNDESKTLETDPEQAIVETFTEEEKLVCYYIVITIKLSKHSDALKAIEEYRKKKGISYRAQAHLYQFEAVLKLMSHEHTKREIFLFKEAKRIYQYIK